MRLLKQGGRGNDVMEIQALLKKIGYYSGTVDGIFGAETVQAVKRFQLANGLTADGIIGPNTYQILRPFLNGYNTYTVKAGDTFYQISRKYYTGLARLLAANPGVSANNLRIGRQITVPYGIDVVDTNINYTYDIMKRDIQGLQKRYPFLEVGIAGKSVLGRNLYYLKLGNGANQVFYNAAHHALEWITAVVLMKFCENFLKAYVDGTGVMGYNPKDIWNRSSLYLMPMVNPDGIDLVLNGLQKDNPYYESLIQWNKGRTNFAGVWQANIRGVDLNHNYDASWQLSKNAERSYGIYGPGPTRFSGTGPESEPEAKAVADFTRSHDFRLVIAYHSQGQAIYWNYQNLATAQAREIAERLSEVGGYALDESTGIASYSGYKDWFIEKYRRPGYTIEVGLGNNPLPISQFPQIYDDNEGMLLLASLVTAG